jgi:hypothetical protein
VTNSRDRRRRSAFFAFARHVVGELWAAGDEAIRVTFSKTRTNRQKLKDARLLSWIRSHAPETVDDVDEAVEQLVGAGAPTKDGLKKDELKKSAATDQAPNKRAPN